MDFGRGFAGVGAQYPPGILDQAPFKRDRRGEEQGVQGGAVEAFPDVGPGGHRQQWWLAWLGLEPGQGSGPGLGSHPAPEHDRIMSCALQGCGEPLQVSGPLGEHQAVPPRARASHTSPVTWDMRG